MNKTIVTHLKDKDDNLVGFRVQTKKEDFSIPVVDVRISEAQRLKAGNILKERRATQGSKFIRTSYSLIGRKYN